MFAVSARHLASSHDAIVTSKAAAALAVGPAGVVDPALVVNASATSAATGIAVTAHAAGSGASVAAITSGTNEVLYLDAAGSAAVVLGHTSTGGVQVAQGGLAVTAGPLALPSSTGTGGATFATTTGVWTTASLTTTANGNVTETANNSAITSASARIFASIGQYAGTGIPILQTAYITTVSAGVYAMNFVIQNISGSAALNAPVAIAFFVVN